MPYIKGEARRKELREGAHPKSRGEMNYIATIEIIAKWLAGPMSYDLIQQLYEEYTDTVARNPYQGIPAGVFYKSRERAFREFDRRVVTKYEDWKMEQNGDVYPKEVFAFLPKKVSSGK